MADPSDDIQVLGPEHAECVAAYNLLREELAKRTAELEQARLDLAYTEGERDSGDDTLDLIREAFGFKADEVEGWATLALREIRRIREQRAAPGPLHPEGSTEGHFEPDRSRARCQPESTPSPVPRVWKKGDPEPDEGVTRVRHSNSQHFFRESGPSLWRSGKGSAALTWRELTDRLGASSGYTLTEVIEAGRTAPELCQALEGATGIECGLVRWHSLSVEHEGTTDAHQAKYVGYPMFVRWPWTEHDRDYATLAISQRQPVIQDGSNPDGGADD